MNKGINLSSGKFVGLNSDWLDNDTLLKIDNLIKKKDPV